MIKIDEFGNMVRVENETNDLAELVNKVQKYIEVENFEQSVEEKNNLIRALIAEYTEEIGIRNEEVREYAISNFKEMSIEMERILKERTNYHIDTKIPAIKNEFTRIEEDPKNVKQQQNVLESTLEEDKVPINYTEKSAQLIIDRIDDNINQFARRLNNLGTNQNIIEQIIYDMKFTKNKIVNKYSEKIGDMLKELDDLLIINVEKINDEYIKNIQSKKEKTSERNEFIDEIKVKNEDGSIETNAIKKLEKENRLSIDGIFPDMEEKENSNHSKVDLSIGDLFN